MSIYSILIDLLLIIFSLYIVISSARSGFLRSAVLLVGYFLAVIVAIKFSQYISVYLYDHFIKQGIISSINSIVLDSVQLADLPQLANSILLSLPPFFAGLLDFGVGGINGFSDRLYDVQGELASDAANVIEGAIIRPIVIQLVQIVACIIIILILSILVKVIASLFKEFYRIPILGTLNSILGGVIGIAQACVFLYLIGVVASFVISMSSNSLFFFNENIIDNTYLFKLFYHVKFIG